MTQQENKSVTAVDPVSCHPVSETICVFDLFDHGKDFDSVDHIAIEQLAKNHGFLKVFEFDVWKNNDFYLPVFKLCIKGHNFQSKEAPRP